MKTQTTILILIGAAAIASAAPRNRGADRPANSGDGTCLLTNTVVSLATTDQETIDLTLMREEEKLARDVYLALYSIWDSSIFINIAGSEQRHTDSIARLLSRYEITDPVIDDTPGVFANSELAGLYTELTIAGADSLVAALVVGAAIEDLDIADLEKAIANTDKTDVQQVYLNLLAGSENHLRAFVSQLALLGEFYVPQHISQERFDAIIAASSTKGCKASCR